MTNLCTKVTVRQRPIKNGQISLYLDFYPAIRNQKTGKMTRREYLGIYIYAKPSAAFEHEYNKTMLQKAELIKCRRVEAIINEEFGFLDRSKGKESFLEWWNEKMSNRTHRKNWNTAYMHFKAYCNDQCRFCDLTLDFCQGFLPWLLTQPCQNKSTNMKACTANGMINKLKCVLRLAFDEGHLKVNIAPKITKAKDDSNKREYLNKEEFIRLAKSPCGSPLLKRAGLFSCMTGLRYSDVSRLRWENIARDATGGWTMHITTIKTGAEAFLPISDETLELCGERTKGIVFKGLSRHVIQKYLDDWIKAADITKHITFHCFRHTYATLQLAAGTDIMTISKLLTHSDVSVTQVYAEVIDDKKREAANRISLKS